MDHETPDAARPQKILPWSLMHLEFRGQAPQRGERGRTWGSGLDADGCAHLRGIKQGLRSIFGPVFFVQASPHAGQGVLESVRQVGSQARWVNVILHTGAVPDEYAGCKASAGGRASAALPLLGDVTTSPASWRLASARPALAPKCQLILARTLTRISHQVSTASSDPGMSTALRSVGLLDVLSSTPAGSSVARLVSMPVCAASLRNLVRNAG